MGKLNNLEKKTVIKCEACGGFHSEDESEIILIKIVKGKNCSLENVGKVFVKNNNDRPVENPTPVAKIPEEVRPPVAKRASKVIPPEFLRAMTPPSDITPPMIPPTR